MAVLGNFLFNRTLKQFLACKDLSSASGQALTQKIKSSAKDSLEKILQAIPDAPKPHKDVLKKICESELNRDTEDRFLDNLDSDETLIRAATKNLLSDSAQINPSKLFKRLQENDGSRTELIDILEFQQNTLAPELYVKNALKMEKGYASRLFAIAQANAQRTNMADLNIDPESLNNPDMKIMLIRFLAAVNNAQSARMICRLLSDESTIIVMEALKNLKNMSTEFDPSSVARRMLQMRDSEIETAFDILRLKATGKTLPSLTVLMTGKSDEFRRQACQIVTQNSSEESLEGLLLALDVHEWWGKEQAIKCLLAEGDNRLFAAAARLLKHENEFVRDAANQLVANAKEPSWDLTGLSRQLFNDDWQIRDRAIEQVGLSGNKAALTLLNQVVDKKPESSIAVLKAVARLGFSKGLEITSKCLRKKEAAVQREALLTISKIVTQKHADNVRSNIVKIVPALQATVRDTALDVINLMTTNFNLPKLNLDEDKLFETRLIKIEENNELAFHSPRSTDQTQQIEKTEVVS